jgi:hypothetical protein
VRRNNITPILGTLGVFAVCCGQPKAPLEDAGLDAGADGGLAPVWVDAGPPPLPDLGLTARWDGGLADLETPDASVSPLSEFRLQTSALLDDCRVRILDDDDRMVPNRAAFQRRDGGTVVDLSVTKPIPSKRCCRFVVDGELGDGGLIVSADHHFYQPLQVRFGIWPQPAPPPGTVRHHRRHHRDR